MTDERNLDAAEKLAEDRVTVPWLRKEVLDLFDAAKNAEEIDHAVCIRYLEFLFKMLPAAEKAVPSDAEEPKESAAEQVRRERWAAKNAATAAKRSATGGPPPAGPSSTSEPPPA